MLSFFPTDEWMVECNRVYSTPLLPFTPHAAGILSSISVRNSIAADPRPRVRTENIREIQLLQ